MELQTIKKLIEIGIEKGLTTVEELMDDISALEKVEEEIYLSVYFILINIALIDTL